MAAVYLWARANEAVNSNWVPVGAATCWQAVYQWNSGASYAKINNSIQRSAYYWHGTMPSTAGTPCTVYHYHYCMRLATPSSVKCAWKVTVAAPTLYYSTNWQPGLTWQQYQIPPTSPPSMTEAIINASSFGQRSAGDGGGTARIRVERSLLYVVYTPPGGSMSTMWALPLIGTIISAAQWMQFINFCWDVQVGHRKRNIMLPGDNPPMHEHGNIHYDPWELEDFVKDYRNSRRAYAY